MTHIALFIKDLDGGGIQKVMLHLAEALLKRGHRVDLVVCQTRGPFLEQIPSEVNCIKLEMTALWRARFLALLADYKGFKSLLRPVLMAAKPSDTLKYFQGLVNYLSANKPQAVLSASPFLNIVTVLACKLAKSNARVVISEHLDLRHLHTAIPAKAKKWRHKYLPQLMYHYYPQADAIVTVSDGVADSLAEFSRLPRRLMQTIYNPVVPDNIDEISQEKVDHPWFQQTAIPVVLAVGRLTQQKDFHTLLRAFAIARKQMPVRLVILNGTLNPQRDDESRQELNALATELALQNDVQLLEFKTNPYKYMAHASVLAVSSIFEGFGNVIAEALACGCPVVSTNCPSGPAEILDNGKYGKLVPVSDPHALAAALVETLKNPPQTPDLRARGRMFSVDQAVQKYEKLLVCS